MGIHVNNAYVINCFFSYIKQMLDWVIGTCFSYSTFYFSIYPIINHLTRKTKGAKGHKVVETLKWL